MKFRYLILFAICLSLFSACKKSEIEEILRKNYESTNQTPELLNEFTVQLRGRVLQENERGYWKIIKGEIVEDFVVIDNASNPFSKFKGIPGETYQLEWTITHTDKSTTSSTIDVKIPDLNVEIRETTPSKYKTIRYFEVDPKYKGKWTFDKPYGHIHSVYSDGISEAVENKPSIQLHGYSHTTYKVTYKVNYAAKEYVFTKEITTGEYQEDEALDELRAYRGGHRAVQDAQGRIVELNLQASGMAHKLEDMDTFPYMRALKHLRKLVIGGSSAGQIPKVVGAHYLDLEVLDAQFIGEFLVMPENIGNLKKLKTLILEPARVLENYTFKLPKSFANLESLEHCSIRYVGMVDFNGTLGSLKKLKHLSSMVTELPDDIGNLKNLGFLGLIVAKSYIPESLSSCTNLSFLRLIFQDQDLKRIDLPSKIGNLKKLNHFELTTDNIYSLPESFGGLSSLNFLTISTATLQSIPASIGKLSQLESLTLGGSYATLPEEIGNLKNLKTLFLSPSLTKLPENIGGLSALEYIDISWSAITSLPPSFGNLKNLKEVNAVFSQLNTIPDSFSKLDKLEKIDFGYTKFTSFPEALINLKSIHSIVLNGTKFKTIPTSIYNMREGVLMSLYLSDVDINHLRELVKIKLGVVFQTDAGWIYYV